MENIAKEIDLIEKIEVFFTKPEGKYLLNLLTDKKIDLLEELCEVSADNLYKVQGTLKGLNVLIEFLASTEEQVDYLKSKLETDIDNSY